jgi:hypothetical protein
MKPEIAWREAVRWAGTVVVVLGVGAGMGYAKLPQPPMDNAAQAEAAEAKAKAIEAAKKDAEMLAKAQDRIAERYRKEMKLKGATVQPLVVVKFRLLDADENGCIDRKEAESAPELMANFRALDADHDGRLCSGDLREMATQDTKQATARPPVKKK